MKLVNYTAFKITFSFVIGILCGYYFNLQLNTIAFIIILFLVFLFIAWWQAKKRLIQNPAFGLLSLFTIFLIGIATFIIHQLKNQPSHYSHIVLTEDERFLQLKIRETLKPDLFNNKYIATITAVDETPVTGKIIVAIPKENINNGLKTDRVVLINTLLVPVQPPRNPHQFDYAKYLETQGIYHQIRISEDEIVYTKPGRKTVKGYANTIRQTINHQLKLHGFKGDELAIINALLLGQRQELSAEVYQDFAAAGAVHILAVSGLHVGILMLILSFVLRPLERLQNGKTVKIIAILLMLWAFAIIAGLSPSVLRAVTMFSFLTYALQTNRETNTYNTLLASAFLLLLINPNLLFHVGFQLSYLAVFSIVWIQPKLYKLYKPKFYPDKLFWGIATVTIAAQLGVAPLSLYYFNQFPGLFFITNLVVLPFLGIVLATGILVIILTVLNLSIPFVSTAYNSLLSYLIGFIGWVAEQDSYLFENISFSKMQVIVSYLLIISLVLFWKNFNYKNTVFLLSSIILLQGAYLYHSYSQKNRELVLFHKSRNTLLGIKTGELLTVYSDIEHSRVHEENSIKNYMVGKGIGELTEEKIKNIYSFNGKNFLIIDSTGVYPQTGLTIDFVILTSSPKIHLEKLIDLLQPEMIIADGSNFPSYINRWKETAKKRKLHFHHTGSEGAFIYSK